MISKKIVVLLLIFAIAYSSLLPGFEGLKNKNDKLRQSANFKTFKLQASQNVQDAQQELCPFPGYHGNYCPAQQYSAFKRNLQENGQRLMPSGIGASFDITTGELKLPAIQLTYQNREQIWQDPVSGIQYIVADETNIEYAGSWADVKIFKNEFELSNIWLEATQRGQWLGGEYSSSKDLNDVFERFFRGDQETSISQLTKNVVRLTFKSDNLRLNRFAQRAIDSLPQDLNWDIYNDFLNSWGTHVAVDTHLGGMIEKQTVYKDCVYATPTFTGGLQPGQVEQALHNELQGGQADGFFAARRRVSIDHKFGGNPEDVANWEATISQNPALLKINRFISWDNFVADGQIRANLQYAIQTRINQKNEVYNNHKAYVYQQRMNQRNGPKTAYAIFGMGKYYDTPQAITITSTFTMQDASQCPPGQSFADSSTRCSSGDMGTMDGLVNHVRYERDGNGNYRSILLDIQKFFKDYVSADVYGPWVDRGCSINQPNYIPQYTDFNSPPPEGSWFKILCTDCFPSVYNVPGGLAFQCSCPAF